MSDSTPPVFGPEAPDPGPQGNEVNPYASTQQVNPTAIPVSPTGEPATFAPQSVLTPSTEATPEEVLKSTTNADGKLDQLKCPHCGSTDLQQDSDGVWHCQFCRATFRADDPQMIVLGSQTAINNDRLVIDTADMFVSGGEQQVINAFEQLKANFGLVFVLETVNTITENVDYYARNRAQELGVGDDRFDNGIYILMVNQPHHVQIEAGDGVAPWLSSAEINAIVQNVMLPAFHNNDYVGGVIAGATQVANTYAIEKQKNPAGNAQNSRLFTTNSEMQVSQFYQQKIVSSSKTIKSIVSAIITVIFVVFLISFIAIVGNSGGSHTTYYNNNGGYSYNNGDDSGSYDGGGYDSGGGDFGGGDFGGGSSGGGDW